MSDRQAGREPYPRLVVIGASAGGVEALSTLVGTLPTDFPSPILIAQHLHPDHPSHLAQILAGRSTLPVRSVAEHEAQPLDRGVVLVVPSNRHVRVDERGITLLVDTAGRPKPSVDLLLRTAADVYGEGLIAVILTGMGADGAVGAREVKRAGGTVVIQDPATASFPSMPLSLAPTTVDIVAQLEEIGPLLHDLLTGVYLPQPGEVDHALRSLLEQVRERSGIDFEHYKTPTILRRLQHRMAAAGTERLADYLRYLQRNPEEYQRLVNTFLIKVTEFFRDPDLYGYLRQDVLPKLLREARQRGHELRLWSAGCATGEEAYSLAILVAELLGDEIEQFSVRIFATDLDAEAVEFARHGVYPEQALADVEVDVVDRYFTRLDGHYEINKAVRGLVVFGQHDLGQRSPFPRIDLTLCRNVLIYFTPELQQRALQLFAFSLRDDGYLVLGTSETVHPLGEFFALEHPQLKVYRRQGDRALIPSQRIRDAAPGPARFVPPQRLPGAADLALIRARRESQQQQTARERAERILFNLPVGAVVVDRRYDIQSINSIARRLLGIHGTASGEDFIHLAEGLPSTPLRAAIDEVFRTGVAVSVDDVMTAELATGETSYLQIHSSPLAASGEPVESALVMVTDVTRPTQERRQVEHAYARQQEERAQLAAQVARLAATNGQLLEANRQLTEANTDLRITSEDLLVTNEEVQAATEEVETLNEELQATNEELETLNEELQATVEELHTTNDDLQARGLELQNLALVQEDQRRAAEAERGRLAAVLVAMADAVLVVDADEQPVLTNAAYERTFGTTVGWVPEDEAGMPLPPEAWPQRQAARGDVFSLPFTRTEADGVRHWYEAIGHPVRSDAGERWGLVVIRDITERSLRRLQEQFLAIASHELRTPLTALSGSLQMLERRLRAASVDDRTQKYAAQALEQVRRLDLHVGELMDVARLQSGKFRLRLEPLDLSEVVGRSVETAQLLTTGQTIRLDIADGPLPVVGSGRRLEQVVLNLLTNAVTYAPTTERIDVRLRRAGGTAEVQVQDYGAGIAPTDLANVFSRFFQGEADTRSARDGLGLGLFIAREIVTAHHGTIDVVSTVNEGTTFTVRLPLAAEGERAADG